MYNFAVMDTMTTADRTLPMLQVIVCIAGLAVLAVLACYWLYLLRTKKHKRAQVLSRVLLAYAVMLSLFNIVLSIS